jgi:AcrR family transcriptional regulator
MNPQPEPTLGGRPRGPRGASADTRGALVRAGRVRFAVHGYERTRLRDIAADAGVDAALIGYFFGGKQGLFDAAMAEALHPESLLDEIMEGGADQLGERLLRRLLRFWDAADGGDPLLGLLRSAAGHERSAALLRGFVERELLARVATAVAAPDPQLRASLAGSQLMGIVMARRVLRLEPIASCHPDVLIAAVAPTLQRYLTGDLG